MHILGAVWVLIKAKSSHIGSNHVGDHTPPNMLKRAQLCDLSRYPHQVDIEETTNYSCESFCIRHKLLKRNALGTTTTCIKIKQSR